MGGKRSAKVRGLYGKRQRSREERHPRLSNDVNTALAGGQEPGKWQGESRCSSSDWIQAMSGTIREYRFNLGTIYSRSMCTELKEESMKIT